MTKLQNFQEQDFSTPVWALMENQQQMAGSGGGAVVLVNMGQAIWAIPDAVDASISVTAVSARATSENRTYSDRLGVPYGMVFWGFKLTFEISGVVINPNAGLMAETIGGFITLAAITSTGLGGLAAGGATILQDISIDYTNTNVATMRCTAVYYPDIPAGSPVVYVAGVGQ